MHKKDTIADILSAPDRDELINWLRNQPLLIEQGDVLFAHAGIHPLWDLPTAQNSLRKLTKRSLALSGSVGFKACTAIRSGHPI